MMAWLIAKSYNYRGVRSEIIDNPDGTVMFNHIGASSSLPWKRGKGPITARFIKPYDGPLDDMFLVEGMIAVSGRFRDIVEGFEPGMHGFVPLKMQRLNGTPIEDELYLFSAQQDVDCVITDNDPELFEDLGTYPNYHNIHCRVREPYRSITLSRPQIDRLHLWTGGILCWNELFCSDAFKNAIEAAKIGFVEFNRECSVVDQPWVGDEQMGIMLPRWRAYVATGRQFMDQTL
jgi:hypothetical protein